MNPRFTSEFIRRAPRLALSAFRSLPNPSLTLQNLLVKHLCEDGLFEDVLSVYKRCRLSSCPSDNYTFPFVIKACSFLTDLDFGMEVHSIVMKTGFGDNVFVKTALLDFYARCYKMGNAGKVFDEIPEPDLVSWNALISGYSLNDECIEVFRTLKKLVGIGLKPNDSTFASTLPVCTRSGWFQTGMSLHSLAFKSGYSLYETVIPSLISLYADNGNLSFAENSFDSLSMKSISIWNSMISGYTKNNRPYDAFSMFKKLLKSELKPNSITFISVIPSVEKIYSGLLCDSVHAHVIKCMLGDELPLMTSLLSMYAKIGDLCSSESIFEHMSSRNWLSWNSMISGYVKNGYPDMGLALFCDLLSSGIHPDSVSFISVFLGCSELGALLLGKSAHAYCIKRTFDLDLNVSNSIMSFYSDCSWLSTSFKIFDRMKVRNIVSWNILMSGLMNNNEAVMLVDVFCRMRQEGFCLDVISVITVLQNLDCWLGKSVHGLAIRAGLVFDNAVENALISMYVNCNLVIDANLVFENMEVKSVVSWNAIMTGFRYGKMFDRVMVLFQRMVYEDNCKPNYVTYLNLLPACQCSNQGKSIHGFAIRNGIVFEASLFTSIIVMYARFGSFEYSCLLFEMGNKMNISIWNSIISACVQMNYPEKAVFYFSRLRQGGVSIDYITILGLISAFAKLNDLNLAGLAMSYVTKIGFVRDVAVGNALIDLYARCGDISTARIIFDGLLKKDAVTWGVMINGYGLNGECDIAMSLLSRMDTRADEIVYLSALSACSHAGLVKECVWILDTMLKHGMVPKVEHYGCVVDLLGRKGYVMEGYDLIKGFPDGGTNGVLESLLGACFRHGNYAIGEEIGRGLVEMEPTNSGYYVMLHNVLAAAGKWSDASKSRSYMETLRLRKNPGFSLGIG